MVTHIETISNQNPAAWESPDPYNSNWRSRLSSFGKHSGTKSMLKVIKSQASHRRQYSSFKQILVQWLLSKSTFTIADTVSPYLHRSAKMDIAVRVLKCSVVWIGIVVFLLLKYDLAIRSCPGSKGVLVQRASMNCNAELKWGWEQRFKIQIHRMVTYVTLGREEGCSKRAIKYTGGNLFLVPRRHRWAWQQRTQEKGYLQCIQSLSQRCTEQGRRHQEQQGQ